MKGEDILMGLNHISPELIEESRLENRKVVKLRGRKKGILILAAVFVLALGSVGTAARLGYIEPEMISFMGFKDANLTELGEGAVDLNVSDKKVVKNCITGELDEVEFTAVYSVGDNNTAFIRIDTNIVMPEEYRDEKYYLMPDTWEMKSADGKTKYSGSLECKMDENYKVYYLMELYDKKFINKQKVSVIFGDLYVCELDNYNLDIPMYRETFALAWKYSYNMKTLNKPCNEPVKISGYKCHITNITVSQLSLTIDASVDKSELSKIKDDASHTFDLHIEKLTYRDGTVRMLKDGKSSGYSRDYKGCKIYQSYSASDMDELIDIDELESITVNGVTIKF